MKKLTRRRFLEDSLIAATAAMAVPVSSAVAADRSKPVSPNEKLGVMVMGVNGRGEDHIRGLSGKHGCEITWV